MPEGIDEGLPQGTPDGAIETVDAAAGIEPSFLDVAQYGTHEVTIKVNGEETRVPLSEAVAGYQRQADYTQKTQAHASDVQFASAIRAALQADPKGTLELLAQSHGVTLGGNDFQQEYDIPSWDAVEQVDPRYSQLDQRIAAFEEHQASQQLDAEISRLTSKYGEDFNPQDIVAAAVASGSTDLEATFRQVAFDRFYNGSARAAATTAAKQDASFVAGGASASQSTPDPEPEILTIRDAYRAAQRQHGMS